MKDMSDTEVVISMNKIVITDSARFEELINKIEAQLPVIKDAFQSEKNNSTGMSGSETWKGQSQEALYGKYKQLEQNFTPIEESIEIYIKFLKKTLEDYKELESSIDAKAEEYSDQLNVNS